MDIILSSDNIDVQECDVIATGFFLDERPLRGAPGWMDWRLNGRLSRLIQAKRLSGEWRETILVPSEGRIRAPLILLVGLGRVGEYGPSRLTELATHLVATLNGIRLPNICLSFPWDAPYGVYCGKAAEILVQGIAEGLDRDPRLRGEGWVRNLRLVFWQETDRFEEMLLGIQTATSSLMDRFRIRVSVASNPPALVEEQHEGTPS